MHDRLFEANERLSRPQLVAAARDIGLDPVQFERDLDSKTYRAAIRTQKVSDQHSHVLSTPTFFINGIRFEDSLDHLASALAREGRFTASLRTVFQPEHASSTERPQRQLITVEPHQIVADLPADENSDNAKPNPHDLLIATLDSCIAMTMQQSTQKHKLALEHVKIRLTQSRTTNKHLFRVSIALNSDLNNANRAQLQHAAETYPIAQTLTHSIAIETRMSIDRSIEETNRESFPTSNPPPWTNRR